MKKTIERKNVILILVMLMVFMAGTMTVHATTSVSVEKSGYQTTVGQTIYFTKTHKTGRTIKWSSSDKTVATAGSTIKTSKGSKSKITCKAAGTTYIKCKVGGKTYKCKLTVKNLSRPSSFAVSNRATSINLTWKQVKGASGYEIYRKTAGGNYSLIKTITSGSTLSYSDKDYEEGTDYTYRIRAKYGTYKSSYSYDSIRRLSPASISLVQDDNNLIVKWKQVQGAAGYKVYKVSGSKYTLVKTIDGGSICSYTVKGVKCVTTYKYAVKAVYGEYGSAYKDNAKSKKTSHIYDKKTAEQASCKNGTIVESTCKLCGRCEKTEETDFIPHKWTEWEQVPGTTKMERECELCGLTVTTPEMTGNIIIDEAFMHLGDPYILYGGSYETGIDCSHFVYRVLKEKVNYDSGYHKSYLWAEYGDVVDPKNIKQGDMIVLDGHIAIYLGGGSVIHASGMRPYPSGGIRISNYGTDIYDIKDYYNSHSRPWIGIRRYQDVSEPEVDLENELNKMEEINEPEVIGGDIAE